MSPVYSSTLVLAVTLFLAAASLADDHRKYPLTGDLKSRSNHQPLATFRDELRKPMTPRKGGGNTGHEEAVDKKPINKPVGPHDPHFNEEELIYKPKPKPGHNNVFVETTKDKGKDKHLGGHVNEKIAKGTGN